MMRPILLAALAAFTASVVACDGGGVACTDEARSSVTVTVKDEAGDPVDDAEVVFAVDGGAEQSCDNFDGGSYACGFEIEGEFVVTARKAGFADAVSEGITVEKTDDGCHVEGETVTLTLVAEAG